MGFGYRIERSIMWRIIHKTRLPRLARELIVLEPGFYGERSRLHADKTAVLNDTFFNLSSGDVTVGAHAFFGNGVSVLTGTHDFSKFGPERLGAVPSNGRDIVIGEGVWIASNSTIIGPCVIGEHAVIAAGSLLRSNVAPYAIMAGVPAVAVGDVRTRS